MPPTMNPMISEAVVTGGIFNQHHDNQQFHVHHAKSGFDRLQEAVAPAAFHNSGERFDPPKCHPNTRVAVMQKLVNWILRWDPDTRDALIMWLSGAAGAGKSAIMQSLAELCFSQGCLLASFFFGRSDSTRNHARSLIATIVYQIYSKVPPQVQAQIINVIDNNPLIFTQSLISQFEMLIVHPLYPIFDSGYFDSNQAPRLILIDGLDECLDRPMQRNILDTLLKAIQQFNVPFIFLIASRPEHEIQVEFNSCEMTPIITRLFLDDSYLPDDDIELFLREKFEDIKANHPFKQFLPSSWPSDPVIATLVRKSSGQFIYASVVMRHVKSSRHHPHHRLEEILNLRPPSQDLPFAELDALYMHIFSVVENIDLVLHIISFHIIQRTTIEHIEMILGLNPGDVSILFCDLASIIGQKQGYHALRHLDILHASLLDFLLERTRSKEFYIDIPLHCTEHASKCFQSLPRLLPDIQDAMDTMWAAIIFLGDNFHQILLTPELSDDIIKFSIPPIYAALSDPISGGHLDLMAHFTTVFLPSFLKFMKTSESENAGHQYTQHLQSCDKLFISRVKAYYSEVRLTLRLALVGLSGNSKVIPVGALSESLSLFEYDSHLKDIDNTSLQLLKLHPSHHMEFIELLSSFLCDPVRSTQYALGEQTFSGAAVYSLAYLCDYNSTPQKVAPRFSKWERERRKNTPWKWHRRVIKHGMLGKHTPWMWLRRPNEYGRLHLTQILHMKRGDCIYIHTNHIYFRNEDREDPVVFHRLWSERYYLALQYLLYFLPRSGRSQTLIEFCQRRTFASRSQDFPEKSKKARRAMAEYLDRMNAGEGR